MKKIWKYFILFEFVCLAQLSFAQITLDHSYYIFHKQFYVTDIGNNDYKYVTIDSSGFSLYNLNHSLFISVITPQPLFQPSVGYQVAYITKSLFDCDSANIEYVLGTGSGTGNFYIYRTDGTLLFERDSVSGPYCFGCQLGSTLIQPITNTPEGAKLLLMSNSPGRPQDSIHVYSLCGTLSVVNEISLDDNYVQIFPNPTNGIINFNINLPNNYEKFKLTIYNSSFQIIEETIADSKYQFDTRTRALSSGTYLFDLRTENKVYHTGKFILSK